MTDVTRTETTRLPEHFGAYRIGGGPNSSHKHWAHRWHVDFWFRSWQCEWTGAVWCPRSWTKKTAERKGLRWFREGLDIKRHERKYGHNPVARAERWRALHCPYGVARLNVYNSQTSTQTTHLLARSKGGGTPGDTFCGLTRFDRDGRKADLPGWGVEGGVSGPGVTQVDCPACLLLIDGCQEGSDA